MRLENIINITKTSKLTALCLNIDNQTIEKIKKTYLSDCDILGLRCKISNKNEINNIKTLIKEILPNINKPLMICGCGKDDIDSELLPEIMKILDRECIISFVTEQNYKKIIPQIIKNNHYAVLKTPIDINLAKELNILSVEMGLKKDKIIMNTDIGGLGYGYEYGYSIMEKIRLEGEKGDQYLDMPIISEASAEALNTKEAKIANEETARIIELSAVSGAIAGGANIVTLEYPQNLKIIKGLI